MINRLYFLQASGWPDSFLLGPGQNDLGQHFAWSEIPPLPTWMFFLSALGLLLLVLWLVYACTRVDAGSVGFVFQRERQAAEQRAEGLLRQHISESQYQQLQGAGYLDVPSQLHLGRTYRIPAHPGRVLVFEAGRTIAQLCVIASDSVPQADLILAQKWLIEADEPAYLALANWFDGASPYRAIWRYDPHLELPR